MSKTPFLLMLLAVLWVAVARADEEDTKAAQATLDRAITAMGGAKVLAPRALSGTSRGTIEVLGMKNPVTNEWTVQGLDQVRWSSELTLNDKQTTIVLVVNGEKGWIKGNNASAGELPKTQVAAFRQGMAALRVAESLLPLKEKGWKLSSLGELKIGERAAVGIKASRKGLPELDIYFDKASHLPVKAEMRIEETGGMEAVYVAKFGAYKKVSGRQYFTKLTVHRDDKQVLEMERGEFKAKDKVDEATFAKP
jgi:hypothetical protein